MLLVHSFSLPAQFVCTWRVATWPSLDPLSASANYWVLMQGRDWGSTMWKRGPQFWHEYKVGLILFPGSVFAKQKQGFKQVVCLVSEHPLLLHRFLEYEKASAISCSKQYCVFITILLSKLKSLMCKLQRLETIGLLSIFILPINSSHKLALQKVATTNAMFPLHIIQFVIIQFCIPFHELVLYLYPLWLLLSFCPLFLCGSDSRRCSFSTNETLSSRRLPFLFWFILRNWK